MLILPVTTPVLVILDEHGLSALHLGTTTDRGDIVRKLLDYQGINVNQESKKGVTPILLATTKGKVNALHVMEV